MDVFYCGLIVDEIVVVVCVVGGVMMWVDFVGYCIILCVLFEIMYCGLWVYVMLLLLLGGVVLIEVLGILVV